MRASHGPAVTEVCCLHSSSERCPSSTHLCMSLALTSAQKQISDRAGSLAPASAGGTARSGRSLASSRPRSRARREPGPAPPNPSSRAASSPASSPDTSATPQPPSPTSCPAARAASGSRPRGSSLVRGRTRCARRQRRSGRRSARRHRRRSPGRTRIHAAGTAERRSGDPPPGASTALRTSRRPRAATIVQPCSGSTPLAGRRLQAREASGRRSATASDLNARRGQRDRRPHAAIGRGHHHRAGPGQDAVEADQPAGCTGEHHAGKVVSGKHQRLLNRPRRVQRPPRADSMQRAPLAHQRPPVVKPPRRTRRRGSRPLRAAPARSAPAPARGRPPTAGGRRVGGHRRPARRRRRTRPP